MATKKEIEDIIEKMRTEFQQKMQENQQKIQELQQENQQKIQELRQENQQKIQQTRQELQQENQQKIQELQQKIQEFQQENQDQQELIQELQQKLSLRTDSELGVTLPLFVCSSPSDTSKNDETRALFRQLVPGDPTPGSFVAHDFFIAFVMAARQMSEVNAEGEFLEKPSENTWIEAEAWVKTIGNSLERKPRSLFPSEGNALDHEAPQSAFASELLRKAIDFVAPNNTIFVSHQFSITGTVDPEDKHLQILSEKCAKKTSSKNKSDRETSDKMVSADNLRFNVDILVWSTHSGKGLALAAVEYKPNEKREQARKAQADMYAMNIMAFHQNPCISVDIKGGRDWESWIICASAIVPRSGRAASFRKTTLFVGKGAEGVVGLAMGLIEASKLMSDAPNDFGTLFGSVVGYSKKNSMVTKAYDEATYRRPNFRLIKEFVDCNARMFRSKDNNLYLVSMKYFATDWTKPVSLSVFADILDQLSTLHKNYGPHGDIRLANMLIQTSDDGCRGCLIDFDFVDMNGNSRKYPSGFNVTIEDGKRHPQAIANEEMQMDHDYHSMKAVMEFFKVEGSVASAWERSMQFVGQGQLSDAVSVLREKGGNAMATLSQENVTKFANLSGTGGTPPKLRGRREMPSVG
jgi:hypothetical protein